MEWLIVAASVAGFTGFAVGRTTCSDRVAGWRDGHFTAEEAASAIANRYGVENDPRGVRLSGRSSGIE